VTVVLVTVYLAAIVAANLIIAELGPSAAIPVAFALVGLDLTTRDALHDRWDGAGLLPRMVALIGAGGVLSWIVNADAGPVAVASTVAFVAAAVADTVVYRALGDRAHLLRINGSNVAGATVDSLLFIPLAFGVIMPTVMLAQLAAKIAGGAVWSVVLRALEYRSVSLEEGAPMSAGDFVLYLRVR